MFNKRKSLLSPHCNSDSITFVLEAQSTVYCMLSNTIHLHYPPGAEKNSMSMGVHLWSGVCTHVHMGKLISLVLDHLLSVLSAGTISMCVYVYLCVYLCLSDSDCCQGEREWLFPKMVPGIPLTD